MAMQLVKLLTLILLIAQIQARKTTGKATEVLENYSKSGQSIGLKNRMGKFLCVAIGYANIKNGTLFYAKLNDKNVKNCQFLVHKIDHTERKSSQNIPIVFKFQTLDQKYYIIFTVRSQGNEEIALLDCVSKNDCKLNNHFKITSEHDMHNDLIVAEIIEELKTKIFFSLNDHDETFEEVRSKMNTIIPFSFGLSGHELNYKVEQAKKMVETTIDKIDESLIVVENMAERFIKVVIYVINCAYFAIILFLGIVFFTEDIKKASSNSDGNELYVETD